MSPPPPISVAFEIDGSGTVFRDAPIPQPPCFFASSFIHFLLKHHTDLHMVDTWDIPLEAIAGAHPSRAEVRRTQFLNTGEGYLFSEVIRHAASLQEAAAVQHIIDLGTGSGLPSLRTLWGCKERNPNLKLTGVDIDPEAIAVAQHNARILGVEDHSLFVCQDISDFLASMRAENHCIVVANPPYIPVPDNIDDPFFIPIHAGSDGLNIYGQYCTIPGSQELYFAFLQVR